MVRHVTVAATQMGCSRDPKDNMDKAEHLVREAAASGANIILIQELFQNIYFCQEQNLEYFRWAEPLEDSIPVGRFRSLAKELGVVLPVSFFERANNSHFNSLATIDADGTLLGVYRKSHIPDGPGYQEKFFMTPGDTGFKVYDTKFGRIGTAICWDEWFPECARCMALQGAELLLYPTAIGSEPSNPSYNSYPHFCRTLLGHAAANMVPVVASNRIGPESTSAGTTTYYGGSFISGPRGEVLQQVGGQVMDGNFDPSPAQEEGLVLQTFDFDQLREDRVGWGLFRDRRPDLYGPLLTFDGHTRVASRG